jgi:hypothetical protein
MLNSGRLRPHSQILDWVGETYQGQNGLTYYEHSSITDVNCFITLGPGANVIKVFMGKSYDFS